MTSVVLAPTHCKQLKTFTTIAVSAVAVPLTGTLIETTLATIALAAGAMGPNGIVRIWHLWSYTNSGNAKTPRIKFGGTAIFAPAPTTQNSGQGVVLVRNRNAQYSQITGPAAYFGVGGIATAPITMAIDTSIAQNILFTGQLANVGDTLTLEGYQVEVLYGA